MCLYTNLLLLSSFKLSFDSEIVLMPDNLSAFSSEHCSSRPAAFKTSFHMEVVFVPLYLSPLASQGN